MIPADCLVLSGTSLFVKTSVTCLTNSNGFCSRRLMIVLSAYCRLALAAREAAYISYII